MEWFDHRESRAWARVCTTRGMSRALAGSPRLADPAQ